jgi:PAS domain S-box-containing protein
MSEGGDSACWAHLVDVDAPRTASDAQLLRFVRTAADAVIVCERDGTIVFWNLAAETMFGWSPAEAVGQSLDLIIPERFRARHWKGWHAAVDRGTTAYADRLLQVPATTRDGTTISIASSMTMLFDAAGAVEGIAAVIRDETEARRHRLELEARLRSQGDD